MRRPKLRAAALGAAALTVGVWSSRPGGHRVDVALFRLLNAGRGPAADRAFAAVTELGSVWASAGAAAALAARGRGRAAANAMGAAGAAWLLGQGLKRVFGRPRPYEAYPDDIRLMIGRPAASSWPSSHPMVLLAFATVAGRELGLGTTPRAGLGALAGLVGVSRAYLGVHYPSDVAGGLLLGRALGLAWPRRRASRSGGRK